MSASRTERLLNLLIALLNTKYGLRRSELREKVYHDTTSSDVAFGRMFERDKGELRQFGFDVETVTDTGWGSDDPATTRYRIGKESNRLPDVSLTPEECTVLILAAQLWEHAALGSAAVDAVRKLQAAGGLVDAELPTGVQPRIRPAGQAFEDLVAAIHAQHPVRFSYLAGSTGQEQERLVEPWGLGSRFGQWYLVGHDRGRGDKRFFRLSRLTSAVTVLEKESFTPPAGFNVRAELAGLAELPVQSAVVDVEHGRLLGLRKRAQPLPDAAPEAAAPEARTPGHPAGTDRLAVPFRDAETLGEELASYGPRADPAARVARCACGAGGDRSRALRDPGPRGDPHAQDPSRPQRRRACRASPRRPRLRRSRRRATALEPRLAAVAGRPPALSRLQPGQPAADRHAAARGNPGGRIPRLAEIGVLRTQGGDRAAHLVPLPALSQAAQAVAGRRR